jgi:hypothetical protein
MKKTNFLTLLATLGLAATSFGQINTSDLSGYVGSFYLGNQSLDQASGFAAEKMLSQPGLSLGGEYSDYSVDDDTNRRFDGDVETTSGSVAYVHALEALNLGLVLTAVDGSLDVDGTDLNPNVTMETEADGWLFTLGAAKTWERLSLVLTGTMGTLSLESDREDGNLNTKTSDYDLTLYQIELSAYYAWILDEDYSISPFVKIGYASIENDGIDESNSPDAVSIDDYEDERPYAVIGLQGELLSLGALVPYASLSVWQDLGDDETELEGTDAATNTFSFDVPDAVGTAIRGELGFNYAINEDWSLSAAAGYFTADKLDGFDLGLSAVFSF